MNRRGRDFTDGQRDQLDLLRPHLRQAYLVAQAHRRMREDVAVAVSGGLCEVDAQGGLGWTTALVERLLAHYFPGWKPGSKRLPSALWALLRETVAKPIKKEEVPLVQPRSWQFARESGTLTARLAARLSSDRWQLLLTEELPEPPAAVLAQRHGLTKREAETLYWLGQAKANGEIGIILGISVETVKEYVAQVLAKLAVPNRTAAARMALAR